MLKININIVLPSVLGGPIVDEQNMPLTFKKVAVNSVIGHHQEDNNLSPEEKYTRYLLAVKLGSATDEVELSAEDIVLMKRLVSRSYAVSVVGPMIAILEGKHGTPICPTVVTAPALSVVEN